MQQLEWEQLSFMDIISDLTEYKIHKTVRLIELFGGIGAQAMALERLGVPMEHYRMVEYDKYPVKSYNAIHGTNFEPMDITKIHGWDLGVTEKDKYTYLLTYSFPCQDLSVAGKGRGMKKGDKTRSGLLWEVERLLDESPLLVAQRGRVGGQMLEPREDITNALTSVPKDNLVLETAALKMVRTEEGKALRKDYEAHKIHHGYSEHKEAEPRKDGLSNTITTVQKDNMIVDIKQATNEGYIPCQVPGVANLSYPESNTRRGRVVGGGTDMSDSDNGEYP